MSYFHDWELLAQQQDLDPDLVAQVMRLNPNVYPAIDEEGRFSGGWTTPHGTLVTNPFRVLLEDPPSYHTTPPTDDGSDPESQTDENSPPARKGDPHILERI